MFATVYVLFYGKYHNLHKRMIDGLRQYLPRDDARLVCWANTVCNETMSELFKLQAHFTTQCRVVDSNENVPKYRVMRKLYHEQEPPQTPWILWMDDDTYIMRPNWWSKTKAFLKSDPKICYVGQKWYVHHEAGQWDFIKASPWFRGKKPEMLPTRQKGVKKPGVWFMTGGYVWLRTDVMKSLDWPDQRLNHNGGDTLLGEAIRQQGLPRHHFDYGVMVNKAKRRGLSEAPAGATNKRLRR
jgi:GT2 family glycosyltransferase